VLDRVWTLHLWGLADRRLELTATVVTVLALAWTRFAFLASGPWEWDETLFARGILRFDIHAHFPHPPGFPLWLALGWLVSPLVSEPLRALQLLSAAFSVLTLWPLAALCRRVSPPAVAMTTALVFLVLPGVWLHAPRGFSATPAAFFALWGAVVAIDGLAGRRATLFAGLVTASFLIRPILLPSLGLLWLAGALSVHPRRRLLPGIAIGIGATVTAAVAMVLIQGNWSRFIEAFSSHATRHARGLAENVVGLAELGIVKGTGGVWPSLTLLILAGLGLVVWKRRRGWRLAAAWAIVWAVGIAQLVWLQDRKYPRYAVPFQLAAAPLVAAGAAAAAPAAAAAGGLAALGAFLAVRAYPVVEEQHSNQMSMWAAVRFASAVANRNGYELLLEPGIAPFVSYLQELDKRDGRPWTAPAYGAPTPSAVRALPKGRFLLITDRPERYLTTMGRTWAFTLQSEELTPLSQGRWQHALVHENPVLPVRGWGVVARDERDIPFVWGGTQATLQVPPLPTGTCLAMELEPTRGPAALELQANGITVAVLAGAAGRRTVWVPPGLLSSSQPNELSFTRPEAYATRPGGRAYAFRLSGLRAAGGAIGWSGTAATPRDHERLGLDVEAAEREATSEVRLTGVLPVEAFPYGPGTWTEPVARLDAPVSTGMLTLLAWAPRPTPPRLEVWLDGTLLAGPLAVGTAPSPLQIILPRDAAGPRMVIELRSAPHLPRRPAGQPGAAGLGIVLGGIELDGLPGLPTREWLGAIDPGSRRWAFHLVDTGFYTAETFGDRRGAWTKPTVRLTLPPGPGRIDLVVAAPRTTSPRLEVWADDLRLAGPFDPPGTPVTVSIPLPAQASFGRTLELELRSVPFVPARHGVGKDTRSLGVVLFDVTYVPEPAPDQR